MGQVEKLTPEDQAKDIKNLGYWSKINRGKRGKKATCCPDKTHYAKGLCKKCYYKDKWNSDPVWKQRQSDLGRIRQQKSPARVRNLENIRTQRDKKLYNLQPGERKKIWEFQKGVDPISGDPLVPRANLDHDHKTGLIRGLLNPLTNKFLVDNAAKLKAMLAYIENPPAPAALGETVYGLMGLAKHKKKMRYGPKGDPYPHSRTPRGI